ncbi:MFS transporter [Granulicella arctica]|uniref:MFS transporter n=1 Tax=Granulicella arctica TaxID=940613 RepID=UPI0021E0BBE4|nr:MFS transporter [Granulicella arctica]
MQDSKSSDAGEFSSEKNRLAQAVSLYLGFTGTGICCALMGVLLPTLLSEWHLDDHAGGLIFLLIWVGSSIGALMVLNALRLSVALGCAAIAVATGALAFFGRSLSSPLMLLYGVGLGLTMTSISLLRQKKESHARSVELVRLNLTWAIGACVCPVLMSQALRSGNPRQALLAVTGLFAAIAGVTLLVVSRDKHLSSKASIVLPTWTIFRQVPITLILMTVLATGIEASGGSWLATYAHRSQPGVLFTIAAPTCLWAGLLSSRFLGSFADMERQMRRYLNIFLAMVVLSTMALVSAVHGGGLLIASLILGFGLGPLYPIFLAKVLTYQQGGAIFFLAGVSSAIMPWMTGVVSTHFSSLSLGLIVPAAGAVVLLLLGVTSWSSAATRLMPRGELH